MIFGLKFLIWLILILVLTSSGSGRDGRVET